jgi:amidase
VFAAMDRFFDHYDVLLTVTSQVPPFPIDLEYPTEITGVPMATYIEWMRSCSRITVTSCPALSLPAELVDGLPVGVQLVTRHRTERRLLEIAAGVEELIS